MPRRTRSVVLCRSVLLPILAAAVVLAAVRVLASTLVGGGPLPDGSSVRTDCYLYAEAVGTRPVNNLKYLVCPDGDPTCDQDATCNGHCSFRARVCTGLTNQPFCSPPPALASLRLNRRCPLEPPATLSGSTCGAFVDFQVATKGGGRRRGRRRCTGSARAAASVSARVDLDVFVFTCAPCGSSPQGALLAAVARDD
jgi:hypothetical protein